MIALVIALSAMTGFAVADGLTFSGGRVGVKAHQFYYTGGGTATFTNVNGAAAFDFDSGPWEVQANAGTWTLLPGGILGFSDARVILAKQTGASTKIGGYLGILAFSGTNLAEAGVTGMTMTSAGAYLEGEAGIITGPGGFGPFSFLDGRYRWRNWFGNAQVVSAGGTNIFTVGGGYRIRITPGARLDAGISALSAGGGATVTRATLDLRIPLGGADQPGDIDSRLFPHRNILPQIGF